MTSVLRSRRTTRGLALTTALGVIVGTGIWTNLGIDVASAALGVTQFEIDGNTAVNGGQDWASAPAVAPNLQGAPWETAEPCNAAGPDPTTVDGKLNTININNPIVEPGNVPGKTDLCSVYRAWELIFVPEAGNPDPSAGQYQFLFYGAWSRPNVNGEIDVLFPLLGDDPGSQTDDLIIAYDFQDSSDTTDVRILTWDGDSWEPTTLDPAVFVATTTRGVETHATSGDTLTFGEFAINLTLAEVIPGMKILPEDGPCVSFTSGDPITRTGNSASAALKDIVDAQPIVLTNCGSLTVTKQTVPAVPVGTPEFGIRVDQQDGHIMQFDAVTSITDTLTIPDAASVTYDDLLISPDYAVAETGLPAGWTERTLVCDSFDPLTGQNVTRTLYSNSAAGPDTSFPIAPGVEATCVIVNDGPPTVLVQKSTVGGAGGPFGFTVTDDNGDVALSATTAAADTPTAVDGGAIIVAPGAITVTESSVAPGFFIGELACDVVYRDGSSAQFAGSFELASGDSATCVQQNIAAGSVNVTKVVDPPDATGWSFDFTISPVPGGETATKTATPDAPSVGWDNLEPGVDYTITEADTDGYITGLISCGGTDAIGTSTFTTGPGQTIECAAANTELANVSVTKTISGTATAWSFDFTISPVPAGEVATKSATASAATVTWDGLVPGTEYTITETPVDGFISGVLDCGGTDAVGSSTFAPSAGEDVACAITNTELADVSVTKTVSGTATAWSFDFTISPVPAGEIATKSATASAATVTWDGLVPGTEYTITETPAAGFISGVLDCGGTDAVGSSTFAPTPGAGVGCTITNTELADVAVTKTVNGLSTNWSFDFTISPVPGGETATKTATSAAATVTWDGLVPGAAYTITETSAAGYITGALTCTGGTVGTGASTFTPAAGQSVPCAITNTQLAAVSVTKTVAPVETGWNFDFTISPVPAGETATKTATSAAATVSWAGLVPGTAYTITEGVDTDLVVGTMTCTGGTAGQGASTFTPAAGQSVACSITNTRIADIQVTKTAGAPSVLGGGPLAWSIKVTNNGPSTARQVVLTDELPAGLTLVSVTSPASWDCSATVTGSPGKVSCSKPDMLVGETWTFTVNTTVTGVAPGATITNVAVVSTTTDETTTDNNTDSASSAVEIVAILPPTGGYIQVRLLIGSLLIAAGIALLLTQRRHRFVR